MLVYQLLRRYNFGGTATPSAHNKLAKVALNQADLYIEHAKTGRAGCQNTACKAAGSKILKGELRMGTLVWLKGEIQAWMWKHW